MLLKHPLFWKEWRSAKWWSALIMGIFLLMFLAINSSLQNAQEIIKSMEIINGKIADTRYVSYYLREPLFINFFHEQLSNVALALIPIVIVISTLLFHSDRKDSVGAFISSLPYKKKEQFRVKWTVGALAITIPFILSLILAMLIRNANWEWIEKFYEISNYTKITMPYDTLEVVILSLLQTYLFFIAFYSFIMFIQSIIANNIAASIIGCIVPLVPWFLLEAGGATLSHILQKNVRIYPMWNENSRWLSFYNLMFIGRTGYMSPNSIGTNIVTYNQYGVEIVILLLVTIVSIYTGIWFYGKNDNSRNGYVAMFPWVQNVLIVGITICSSILGNNILRSVVRQSNTMYEMVTLMISGIIGYFIICKLINTIGRCEG